MRSAGKKLWGYYAGPPSAWIPLQVDINGFVKVDMSEINLGDLGDVTIAALADGHFLSYSVGLGYWQNRLLADADIPAAIARDAEVANAITAHADLTTGVHGLGALHAAGFHTAGQAVSKVIWNDNPPRALADINRTVALDWTDLDLTAHTSANAKFAILGITFVANPPGTAGYSALKWRKKGTTPVDWYEQHLIIPHVMPDGFEVVFGCPVGLDSGQVMQYKIIVATAATVHSYIDVHAYIE